MELPRAVVPESSVEQFASFSLDFAAVGRLEFLPAVEVRGIAEYNAIRSARKDCCNPMSRATWAAFTAAAAFDIAFDDATIDFHCTTGRDEPVRRHSGMYKMLDFHLVSFVGPMDGYPQALGVSLPCRIERVSRLL